MQEEIDNATKALEESVAALVRVALGYVGTKGYHDAKAMFERAAEVCDLLSVWHKRPRTGLRPPVTFVEPQK